MPSVPMAMPSVTAIVLNSIGVPPAARMPSFTFSGELAVVRVAGRDARSSSGRRRPAGGEVLVGEADRPKYGGRRRGRDRPGGRGSCGGDRTAWRRLLTKRGSRSAPAPPGPLRAANEYGGPCRGPLTRGLSRSATAPPGRSEPPVGGMGGHLGPRIYRLIALCTQLLMTSMPRLCQGSGSRPLVRYANDTPDSGSAQQ